MEWPEEVGGFPGIAEIRRPSGWGTDGDGIPDEWEKARGLNPDDAKDGNGDYDDDGYTNLEEYLNEVGAFPANRALFCEGERDNRYARIENRDMAFQPSRLDMAVVADAATVVDAVDRHGGVLRLAGFSWRVGGEALRIRTPGGQGGRAVVRVSDMRGRIIGSWTAEGPGPDGIILIRPGPRRRIISFMRAWAPIITGTRSGGTEELPATLGKGICQQSHP